MPTLNLQVNSSFHTQELLYKLTFEHAAAGIAQLNKEGRFIKVNNKFAEITGYSKDELIQKTFQDITHPDDLDYDLREAEALLLGEKTSYCLEKRYIRKGGNIAWIKHTGSAIISESGEFIMFVAVIEDITEKKNTEEQLKEKKEQLSKVPDSITDCYVSLDKDWRILDINKEAERKIFEKPANKLIGKVLWDLYPKGKGGIFHKEYERAFKENVPVHFEAHSNVTDKWLEVHAYPQGSCLGIFFRDISKRKELENELRKSERKFSKLFYSSPQFMFINEFDTGKFIEVNDAFCKLTGYSRQELLGNNSAKLGILPQNERNEIIRKVSESGEIVSARLEIVDKKGKLHTVIYSSVKTILDDKYCLLFSGIDVTEQVKTADTLVENEKKLQLVLNNSVDGIHMIDLTTNRYVFMSPSQERLTGFKIEELNLSMDETAVRLHPDDVEVVNNYLAEIINGKQVETSMQYRWKVKNGDYRWFSDSRKAVLNDKGEPIALVGISRDITKLKETEEALKNNQELLQNILEVLPVGVFISDEKGNLVQTNRAAQKLWGGAKFVPIEKLHEYKGWWRKTGKRIESDEWAFARAFLKGETSENELIDIECFDGTQKTIMNFAAPVKDEKGKTKAAVAVAMDITERIIAEETLRRMVEENEKLMDILPAAIFISEDQQCNYIKGNRMAATFYEVDEDENVSANSNDARRFFINGKEQSPDELPMQKAARENKPVYNNVVEVLLPSGRCLYMHGSSIPLNDEKGNVRGAIGAYVDITKHIETEKALRESEENFRLLANSMSQFAWIMDDKGWVFWYNQRWFDYTGTTYEEMQGWGWQKVHHPNHIDRVLKSKRHSIESGEVWEEVFPLRGRDGNYRWFLTRAIPVKNDEGKIVRWFGTNTDVTHQRQYEERLEYDKKLYSDLLHIAAHDLKGPVANMYGALDLMDRLPVEKKLLFLNQFRNLADRLNMTINGVTDILRMRNTDKSAASAIDMNTFINNILLEFKDKLEDASIQSKVEKPVVNYIEVFLLSIIKNLISNAIKYRRENVNLCINIILKPKDEYTLLSISDNGTGIDLEKNRDNLFTPFKRFAAGKIPGTGIGLYIIKDIIEKNGGYIEVESALGEGTTFHCYLKEY